MAGTGGLEAEPPLGAEALLSPKEESIHRILARCGLTLCEACEAIMLAACAAAEAAFEFSGRAGSIGRTGIASESNDGYSVSYQSGASLDTSMAAAVRAFLPGGLLYRGAGRC